MKNSAIAVYLTIFFMDTVASMETSPAFYGIERDLCGKEDRINLTESGLATTMALSLTPIDPAETCILRIIAPKNYLMKVQFVETTSELHRARIFNHTSTNPPCMMSIFLPQNRRKAVWVGDPCSNGILPDIDLLTPQFRIVWNAPTSPTYTKGRKIILTAIGKGPICNTSGVHICSRIGWEPELCIADHFLCDGTENCPKGSSTSDEDDKICKSHLRAQGWEQVFVDIVKKLKRKPSEMIQNKWLEGKLRQFSSTTTYAPKSHLLMWQEFEERRKTETTTSIPPPQKAGVADSITEVLSRYGPWGYLMLGMLICGTVLMFCGLWECCFRRPKPHDDEPIQTPPTTVLVINQHVEDSRPPSYEELDQPPAYSVLFPNLKDERTGSAVMDEAAGDSSVAAEEQCENIQMSVQCPDNSENTSV